MKIDTAKAKILAVIKHEGQVRIGGEPYVNHPIRVAEIVREVKPNSRNLDMLEAAAYLHDTIEDTFTSPKELTQHFGEGVSSIVLELSSAPFACDFYGKEKYLARKMLGMTPYALIVKLADRLDNIRDMLTDHFIEEQIQRKFSEEQIQRKYAETQNLLNYLKAERNLTSTHKELIRRIEEEMGY